MVRGTVRDGELVTEPTEESWKYISLVKTPFTASLSVLCTFLRICELFPPVGPVPGDLTEPTVEPEPECDGNDPDGIEEEDAGRHEYLEYLCSQHFTGS